MEKELFDWTGWDGDLEYMIFYNPVLKIDIGNYKKGKKFNNACISFLHGFVRFYENAKDENPTAEFKLKLLVVE